MLPVFAQQLAFRPASELLALLAQLVSFTNLFQTKETAIKLSSTRVQNDIHREIRTHSYCCYSRQSLDHAIEFTCQKLWCGGYIL